MDSALEAAITERNEILKAMDVERAKAWITKHGGTVPKRSLDWEIVLHLARFEITSMPPELIGESHVALAQSGKYGIANLAPKSPYLLAALDLIFPKTIADAEIDEAIEDAAADLRMVAEVFDARVHVREEMETRGMTERSVGPVVREWLTDPTAPMTNKVSQDLATLFATSQDFWRNLDAAYQKHIGGRA